MPKAVALEELAIVPERFSTHEEEGGIESRLNSPSPDPTAEPDVLHILVLSQKAFDESHYGTTKQDALSGGDPANTYPVRYDGLLGSKDGVAIPIDIPSKYRSWWIPSDPLGSAKDTPPKNHAMIQSMYTYRASDSANVFKTAASKVRFSWDKAKKLPFFVEDGIRHYRPATVFPCDTYLGQIFMSGDVPRKYLHRLFPSDISPEGHICSDRPTLGEPYRPRQHIKDYPLNGVIGFDTRIAFIRRGKYIIPLGQKVEDISDFHWANLHVFFIEITDRDLSSLSGASWEVENMVRDDTARSLNTYRPFSTSSAFEQASVNIASILQKPGSDWVKADMDMVLRNIPTLGHEANSWDWFSHLSLHFKLLSRANDDLHSIIASDPAKAQCMAILDHILNSAVKDELDEEEAVKFCKSALPELLKLRSELNNLFSRQYATAQTFMDIFNKMPGDNILAPLEKITVPSSHAMVIRAVLKAASSPSDYPLVFEPRPTVHKSIDTTQGDYVKQGRMRDLPLAPFPVAKWTIAPLLDRLRSAPPPVIGAEDKVLKALVPHWYELRVTGDDVHHLWVLTATTWHCCPASWYLSLDQMDESLFGEDLEEGNVWTLTRPEGTSAQQLLRSLVIALGYNRVGMETDIATINYFVNHYNLAYSIVGQAYGTVRKKTAADATTTPVKPVFVSELPAKSSKKSKPRLKSEKKAKATEPQPKTSNQGGSAEKSRKRKRKVDPNLQRQIEKADEESQEAARQKLSSMERANKGNTSHRGATFKSKHAAAPDANVDEEEDSDIQVTPTPASKKAKITTGNVLQSSADKARKDDKTRELKRPASIHSFDGGGGSGEDESSSSSEENSNAVTTVYLLA